MLNWVQDIPNNGLICFRGFFNQHRLIPTSPETLKSVLSDNSYDFEKPLSIRKFLAKILGAGLILVEGDVHKFQRKNVLPSFQLKHIKELYPVFWGKSRGLVEGIEKELAASGNPEDHVVEFGEWATRVTLDIIGLAGMGRDFNAVRNDDDPLVHAYNELLEPTVERAIYFAANIVGPQDLVQKLPINQNKLLRETTGKLKYFCLQTVRDRREKAKLKGERGNDILSLLIETNNFSDEELVDQMLTFLAAGYIPSSTSPLPNADGVEVMKQQAAP
jgi:cytochrome P450